MSYAFFRYIRRQEFQHLLGGISRSKFETMVAEGMLPQPYKIGKRNVAWRSDEVEKALATMPRAEPEYAQRAPLPAAPEAAPEAPEPAPALPKRGRPRKQAD